MANWQSGLCSCYDDCGICCYGCWCTACLYGKNAQQIDGSDYDEACMTYCCSGPNPLAVLPIIDNRKALRDKYGLAEEPCDECLVIFCCAPCAVCQAARELKIRSNMSGPVQKMPIMVQPTNHMVYMQPIIPLEPISIIQPQ